MVFIVPVHVPVQEQRRLCTEQRMGPVHLAIYGTEKRTRNDPSVQFHLKNQTNLVAATKFAILLGGTMIVDCTVVSKTGLWRHQRRRQ